MSLEDSTNFYWRWFTQDKTMGMTREEFHAGARHSDEKTSDEEINMYFDQLDSDQDGFLGEWEFKNGMMKLA